MQGDLVAGRYELEEVIGRGGMSSVFRAHDQLLERKVALKILHEHYTSDSDYVERFRREARAAAQLGHPNIVTVIDRGEQDGRQYIVFEYVQGQTLKELVVGAGPLPVRQALQLGLQVARALAFAHEQGVVHRDVKPQNVLLDGDGQAKVTDFGIARSLDVTSVTEAGTVLGTSDYIAPEQATGDDVDPQSDIYSFGAVLYELLTGDVPFPADNFVAAALRHVNDPPPSVLERRPETPIRLAAAVDQMLEKDRDDRYGSMQAVIAELTACLDELGEEPEHDATVIARRPGARAVPSRRRQTRGRRWLRPALFALLALACLAGVSAGLVYLTRGDADGRTTNDGGPGPAPIGPVRLTAIDSYDPLGDDTEHDYEVADATDGDPATSWRTETYNSFTKAGVGLLVDAGRAVALREVTIQSRSPGFKARIRAGATPDGVFTFRSGEQTVGASTKIVVRKGASFRYYVVWITELAGKRAEINELRAKG